MFSARAGIGVSLGEASKSERDSVLYPFTAFNFRVEINLPDSTGVSGEVCGAAFSEIDGLEMTREVKTIREGGNNGVQIRLTGPISYGALTLKRGMTQTFDLWKWFEASLQDPSLRADAHVLIMAPDHQTVRAKFLLTRCIPVKLKAPPLNAKDGAVAIEELGLAYESLKLEN